MESLIRSLIHVTQRLVMSRAQTEAWYSTLSPEMKFSWQAKFSLSSSSSSMQNKRGPWLSNIWYSHSCRKESCARYWRAQTVTCTVPANTNPEQAPLIPGSQELSSWRTEMERYFACFLHCMSTASICPQWKQHFLVWDGYRGLQGLRTK